jgi:ubiquinone biosynthesis protein
MTTGGASEISRMRRWAILSTMLSGTMLAILDSGILNVLVDPIMEEFQADLRTIEWVLTSYNLAIETIGRSDLLVMGYIQGEPVRAARTRPMELCEALASMILHNYLKQIFMDNFFHADPHPGNILLLDQGQIGYLDFGAMGRLDRTKGVADVVIQKSLKECAARILELLDAPERRDTYGRAGREHIRSRF